MKSTLLVHNPIKSEVVFNSIKSLNKIPLLAHGEQMKSRFPVAKESSVVRKSDPIITSSRAVDRAAASAVSYPAHFF
jgi:hypothetical protein